MEQADYVHLVRVSELASAENSHAYRRSVALFAALGYAWVLGCLILALCLLLWAGSHLLAGQWRFVWVMTAIASLSLFWNSLRALWFKVDKAEGIALMPEDAPALFEALERIRRKMAGPGIDAVYLTRDFNASIRQVPRWGVVGGVRNELSLGLPLMMAQDRNRLLAVLAHEYGHLRGGHGKFGAWVYRTRLSWTRLYEGMQDDSGVASFATRKFLHWYFPRFLARTFAMARQDEYEADKAAAGLLGQTVMADALVEIDVRQQWFQQKFWPLHWRSARKQAVPMGPYSVMKYWLAQPVKPAFARQALKANLRLKSGLEDTHPVLRERVDALTGERPQLPQQWSAGGALALLNPRKLGEWLKSFDKQWCLENASAWKEHHARLARSERMLAQLEGEGYQSVADLLLRVHLMLRLDPHAEVRALYQEVLRREPDNAKALAGMVDVLPPDMGDVQLDMLERLFDLHVEYRWWAANFAVELLESRQQIGVEGELVQALKLWRERVRQTSELEDRFSEELMQTPLLSALLPHGLTDFEISEVEAELRNFRAVSQAWLVRKQLNTIRSRPVFLLLAEMDGLGEEEGDALGEQIHDRLEVPGKLYVMRVQQAATLDDIARQGLKPVYLRTFAG